MAVHSDTAVAAVGSVFPAYNFSSVFHAHVSYARPQFLKPTRTLYGDSHNVFRRVISIPQTDHARTRATYTQLCACKLCAFPEESKMRSRRVNPVNETRAPIRTDHLVLSTTGAVHFPHHRRPQMARRLPDVRIKAGQA